MKFLITEDKNHINSLWGHRLQMPRGHTHFHTMYTTSRKWRETLSSQQNPSVVTMPICWRPYIIAKSFLAIQRSPELFGCTYEGCRKERLFVLCTLVSTPQTKSTVRILRNSCSVGQRKLKLHALKRWLFADKVLVFE